MPRYYFTHIWDPEEFALYVQHGNMILVVPACAEYYQATRKHRIPKLCLPEAMLPRGTRQRIACPVCHYINLQIVQGVTHEPNIWDDLAGD